MFPSSMWNLVLLWGVLLASGARNGAASLDKLVTNTSLQPCLHDNPLMNANYETFQGNDVVWQIPSNPRGIIFLAHSLDKTPFSFFDPGDNCKLCYGLPEERLAVLDALENGYAVIALQSVGIRGDWVTWPLDESPDIENTVALLEWWTKKHHLEALPLVAWGHSIGGAFVVSLGAAKRLPLRALVGMSTIDIMDQLQVTDASFPPTIFVHTKGNRYQVGLPSIEQVEAMITALAQTGSVASRLTLLPIPLDPLYFTEHIHCMTTEMSTLLVEELRAEKLLDDENYLTYNPGMDGFAAFMYNTNALPFCPGRNELCLEQDVIMELKRAFGVHTFTSDGNTEIFSWLHSTLGLDDEHELALPSQPASKDSKTTKLISL